MQSESQPPAPVETRKLAAIMFTDIVGFSRHMGADETRMLRLLDRHNQVIHQAVAAHHGHVIKTIGDGFNVQARQLYEKAIENEKVKKWSIKKRFRK
jgi:class 3 adenylate cyclase